MPGSAALRSRLVLPVTRRVVPAPSTSAPRSRRKETSNSWIHSGRRSQPYGRSSSGSARGRFAKRASERRSRHATPSKSSSVRSFQYAGSAALTRSTSARFRGQSIGPYPCVQSKRRGSAGPSSSANPR